MAYKNPRLIHASRMAKLLRKLSSQLYDIHRMTRGTAVEGDIESVENYLDSLIDECEREPNQGNK